MPGIVEEADRRSSGPAHGGDIALQFDIDGLIVRVLQDGHLEIEAFERGLDQIDIIVWILQSADLLRVALVANQQRQALRILGPRRIRGHCHAKNQQEEQIPTHAEGSPQAA